MGLVDSIKRDAKKAGQNKSKFMYFREGTKTRVRFLTDMDDGMEVTFHDSFANGINVPCQEIFGRDCDYCEMEGLRTRSQYIWSVYDYEAKEVKLFMFAVNNCSPIPALMAMYENYGTLVDRDYIISVTGKAQNKAFTVIPMDKVKFRNEKAKPYSEKSILKMLDKAFPADDSEEDKEEYEKPVKKSKKKYDTDIEDDYDDNESEYDENEEDYSSMTPIELYKKCKELKIDVHPRKSQKYYIKQLEDYEKAHDDWDDEDEDEWEDE